MQVQEAQRVTTRYREIVEHASGWRVDEPYA